MSAKPTDRERTARPRTAKRAGPPADEPKGASASVQRQAADQWATLLATSSDGFWRFNMDGKLLDVNDAYCQMSGYSRQELLSLHIADIEAMEIPEDVARHIRTVTKTGFDRFESKHRKKNGDIFDVEISVSFWRTASQFLVIARDITAEAEAEQALRKSEKRYRDLLDTAPDAIVVHRDGRPLYANLAALLLYGASSFDELASHNINKLIRKDDTEKVSDHLGTVMAGRKVPLRETHIVRLDGREVPVDVISSPIDYEGGRAVQSTLRDTSERKRAEEQVRRQAAIIDNADLGVAVYGLEDPNDVKSLRILSLNKAAERILGVKAEDVVGKLALEAFPAADPESLERNARVAQSGVPEHAAEVYYGGDARLPETYFSVDDVPLGNLTMAVLFRDITERKRVEAELEGLARFPSENPNPVLRLSEDGTILYANDAGRTFMNGRRDARGNTAPKFLRALAEEALATQSSVTVDVEHRGQVWSFFVAPIVDSGYVNFYGRDVTERMRAEEALADSQMKLRTLLELMPVGVSVLDGERNVLFSNPALWRIVRLGADDLSARAHEKRVYLRADGSELPPEEIPSVQAARTGEAVEDVELGVRLESGGTVWVSVSATPLPFEDWQLAVISQDITARKEAAEALRESEERLRLAQSSAKVGVWDWDLGRDVLTFTPELDEIYGLAPGTIRTYDDWRGLAHPDDIERVEAARDQAMAGHEPFDLEFRILHGSGEIRWINAKGSAAYDDSGKPVRVFGVNVDVTERKLAEEALRESEAGFRRIVETAQEGIIMADTQGVINFVNAKMADMLGYSVQELIGKPGVSLIDPSDLVTAGASAARIEKRKSGETEHYEIRLRRKDGGELWAYASGAPIHDGGGKHLGNLAMYADITGRKRAEEEMRLQSSALQAAANGIVITDGEGTIQWVNPAFTRLTGYSAAEAIGQNPRVLKSGRHDQAFYKKLWDTVLAGHVWQDEIVNKRKDGSFYTEEMTITPVLDDDRAISHFIAIKQDISRRKLAEEQLERNRSEFLGEVSHELKTPITAIKGCASMALSAGTQGDPAETRELFEIIDAQTNRLTDLVANLLDVTRIEAGRLSMEPGPADLAKIVDEAKVIFEHSQYPHSLEVMLPPKLPALRADGRRIVQVLSNLFTNAAKFSSPTAPIILSAECGGEECTIRVRDSGLGIPEDKRSLLFQKFVQVHERGAKGTGLGLFICKGIVEAHGGRIWAESAGRGKGAIFSFTLPVLKGKRPARRTDGVIEGGRARRPTGRAIRVVAVDDEPDILHYVEHCLRSAGYEVASTSDPLAATELVRFHGPDIVLLDMRMPGMSGLDVLEEIRKSSKVPVTFITATGNREDVIRGREFGGTTWLEKPFSPQQLLDHVGIVLARQRKR